MIVFEMFGLIIVCAFLYLAANLIKYFFFKESAGKGGIFGLSDNWIKKEKK